MANWRCSCGAVNSGKDHVCQGCGEDSTTPSKPTRTTCDCGAALLASGLCSEAGGYPGTMRCPFACPICRGPLAWSGACFRCYGTATGRREDWTFPGEVYELDKGHWQRVAEAGRRACTPEENAQAMRAFHAALASIGRLPTAREGAGA